ncbi:MAG: Xaa-Pro peptidase family protein [Candidatus Aminicenantes bacterium]|nr:Xaa-Pro peptidase family protein [Candidatus Aminicenantes bacterium]
MIKRHLGSSVIVTLLIFAFYSAPAFGQRTGYSKEEFMRRRAALMDKAGDGLIVLFGETSPLPGAHFHQDNDFYYLTGVEDTGAALIMIPRTKQSFLFLPQQTPREAMMGGANLLKDPQAKEKTGFMEIYDVSFFEEYLGRNIARAGLSLYLRLSPRDTIDNARSETLIFTARQSRLHFNDQISLDNHRVLKLRERYPGVEFKDIAPFIDAMRVIKSPEEVEVLRRNGRISAEGVRQAMLATRPGGYEYEIEAAAMYTVLKNGATGAAYPPIVGSGPNTCVLHYEKNERRVEEGDLVLMDFGGLLDYMSMDISRTWPASGRFTKEQREVYEIALEIQKACIEAYRPGVTNADVQEHVVEVMKKKGLDPRGQRGGIGHYVGLCTHDVGPRAEKLQEGMVFAIEPGFYYPEKNIGVRIEDTVLITKDGCEVLTKDVPKEINEVEKLLSQREMKKK